MVEVLKSDPVEDNWNNGYNWLNGMKACLFFCAENWSLQALVIIFYYSFNEFVTKESKNSEEEFVWMKIFFK